MAIEQSDSLLYLASLEGEYAQVDEGRLYYETTGNPKDLPVVLVTTGFLDRRMWDKQFEAFGAGGFWTIRYDLRGLGKSDRPKSNYSDTADLRNLLDYLGSSGPYSLVGVSFGGSVAINFALDYPQKVRCLVLVAPTVDGYQYADAHEERMDREMDKKWDEWIAAVRANRFDAAAEIHLGIMAPRLDEKSKAKLIQIALDNYNMFNNPLDSMRIKAEPPAFNRLAEIKVPTLLVWGDNDFPGQIYRSERFKDLIPGAKKVLIHGADHLVNLSKPEIFNQIVLEFLRRPRVQPR